MVNWQFNGNTDESDPGYPSPQGGDFPNQVNEWPDPLGGTSCGDPTYDVASGSGPVQTIFGAPYSPVCTGGDQTEQMAMDIIDLDQQSQQWEPGPIRDTDPNGSSYANYYNRPVGDNSSPILNEGGTVPSGDTIAAGIQSYLNAEPTSTLSTTIQTSTESMPNTYETPACDLSLYPEQYSVCLTQLGSAGYENVVERPATDPVCDCSYSWADPGTVEGMSTTDAGSYTEAGGVALSTSETIYVFVEGYSTGGGGIVMPDCTNDTVAACQAQLLSDGITTTEAPAEVTWEVPDHFPSEWTGTEGDVIEITPTPGTTVETPDPDVVIDADGVDVPAPLPNEVYTDYRNDLNTAGLNEVNSPLDPTTYDPFTGPDVVIHVSPSPGTAVAPGSDVNTDSNPDTLPATAAGTGGAGGTPVETDPFTSPTVDPDGIEFPSIPTPCNVFPFGIPCWIVNQLGQFIASPVTPTFDVPVGAASGVLGSQVLHIDLGDVFGLNTNVIMQYARPILLFMAFAGFLLWIGHWGSGSGGGGGGDEYKFPAMADSEGGDLSEWNV